MGGLESLLSSLNGHRRHVLGILEGLDDQALHRQILPSGWSPLALLHHLAVDDEVFWFQAVVAGDEAAIAAIVQSDSDGWTVPDGLTGDDVRALYRQAAARSDAIVAATGLDAEPQWWPDFFGEFRLDTVADVVVHVIGETATHAGHLDAARELIDGRQWMVLG